MISRSKRLPWLLAAAAALLLAASITVGAAASLGVIDSASLDACATAVPVLDLPTEAPFDPVTSDPIDCQ